MESARDVSPALMSLWAKHGNRPGYHPLLYHALDVAATAGAIWDLALTPLMRHRLAADLGLSVEDARRWITFLAACHDLGKASPAFARRVPAAVPRLDQVGLTGQDRGRSADAPHGAVSALVLRDLLRDYGMDSEIAERAADVVGGHHGTFSNWNRLRLLSKSAVGMGRWSETRAELVAILARILDLPSVAPQAFDTPTAMWLAGLISVADWIGSDEQYFPWACEEGFIPSFDGAYLARAREQAKSALRRLGWEAQPAPRDELSFEGLFAYHPNDVQQAVIILAPTEPGLVILEAPMGVGKTEAAFWLADHWSRQAGTRGFYVALPTQATSNQMFSRVLAYLRRRYPGRDVNLQLLHGHASLSAEFEALQRGDLFQPTEVDAGEGDVFAAEWFTHRKRGLLAPYGVGTVDQLLLAVLQTRHLFVRLFGLAGKTVVIDEVHAYDTYMSTLIEQLLRWLAALGSPVILLSATLPDSRRQALATAYVEGLGRPAAELPAGTYPRLTWMGPDSQPLTISIPPSPTVRIAIRWIEDTRLGALLEVALQQGGTVAIICNSVARAQQVYTALRRIVPSDDLDLLHARYPFEERAARERRILDRFGKAGDRPYRAVLVATQIVEQSLDLDFDLLVTELPPVDFLLQRMGRLHRHRRPTRPIQQPEVWIISPPSLSNGIPAFDYASNVVYDPVILLRTWIVLQGREGISISADVQPLIEAVYDGPGFPKVTAAVEQRLDELQTEFAKKQREEAGQASQREIGPPFHDGPLAAVAPDPRAEDEPELHPAFQALTRLGEPSIPVVLLDEGWTLPDGTPINPAARPSPALTRQILGRSVPLSSRYVVNALRDQLVPPGWKRSPLLRNHRVVMLPRVGPAQVGHAAVALDPELGVVIEPWKGVE